MPIDQCRITMFQPHSVLKCQLISAGSLCFSPIQCWNANWSVQDHYVSAPFSAEMPIDQCRITMFQPHSVLKCQLISAGSLCFSPIQCWNANWSVQDHYVSAPFSAEMPIDQCRITMFQPHSVLKCQLISAGSLCFSPIQCWNVNWSVQDHYVSAPFSAEMPIDQCRITMFQPHSVLKCQLISAGSLCFSPIQCWNANWSVQDHYVSAPFSAEMPIDQCRITMFQPHSVLKCQLISAGSLCFSPIQCWNANWSVQDHYVSAPFSAEMPIDQCRITMFQPHSVLKCQLISAGSLCFSPIQCWNASWSVQDHYVSAPFSAEMPVDQCRITMFQPHSALKCQLISAGSLCFSPIQRWNASWSVQDHYVSAPFSAEMPVDQCRITMFQPHSVLKCQLISAGSLCFIPIQCWNASWSVQDHYVSAPFSAEMPVDQCRITMFQPHSVLKCQLISAGSLCFSPIQCWNASWSVQDHYVSAPFSAEMPVDQCRITMFQPHSVLKCQLISAGSLCFSPIQCWNANWSVQDHYVSVPFSAEMPIDQCRITMFQPHSVLKCQLISAGSLCFSPIQCWNANWSVQDHYVSAPFSAEMPVDQCRITMFQPHSVLKCQLISAGSLCFSPIQCWNASWSVQDHYVSAPFSAEMPVDQCRITMFQPHSVLKCQLISAGSLCFSPIQCWNANLSVQDHYVSAPFSAEMPIDQCRITMFQPHSVLKCQLISAGSLCFSPIQCWNANWSVQDHYVSAPFSAEMPIDQCRITMFQPHSVLKCQLISAGSLCFSPIQCWNANWSVQDHYVSAPFSAEMPIDQCRITMFQPHSVLKCQLISAGSLCFSPIRCWNANWSVQDHYVSAPFGAEMPIDQCRITMFQPHSVLKCQLISAGSLCFSPIRCWNASWSVQDHYVSAPFSAEMPVDQCRITMFQPHSVLKCQLISAGSLCFSPIQCWNASWSVQDHYVSAPFSAEMPVDQCRITMFQPHSVLKCQLISAGSLCFSPIQCWNASWSVQDHYVSAPFSAEMPVDQCRITMFQPHSVLKCQLISAGSLCFSPIQCWNASWSVQDHYVSAPFSAEMPVGQCRITMFQPHSVLKCQLISAGSLCFSPIQCWNASWSVQDHYVSAPFSAEMPVDQCRITMFQPHSVLKCQLISAGSLCFSPIQCWNASWSVQDHYVSAPFSAEMPVDQCRITMFQPHSVLKCQLISAGSLCFSPIQCWNASWSVQDHYVSAPFSAEMPVDQCRITMFQPHSVLKCQLISAGSLCFSPIQCWNASWSVQDHYVSAPFSAEMPVDQCRITMFQPHSVLKCQLISAGSLCFSPIQCWNANWSVQDHYVSAPFSAEMPIDQCRITMFQPHSVLKCQLISAGSLCFSPIQCWNANWSVRDHYVSAPFSAEMPIDQCGITMFQPHSVLKCQLISAGSLCFSPIQCWNANWSVRDHYVSAPFSAEMPIDQCGITMFQPHSVLKCQLISAGSLCFSPIQCWNASWSVRDHYDSAPFSAEMPVDQCGITMFQPHSVLKCQLISAGSLCFSPIQCWNASWSVRDHYVSAPFSAEMPVDQCGITMFQPHSVLKCQLISAGSLCFSPIQCWNASWSVRDHYVSAPFSAEMPVDQCGITMFQPHSVLKCQLISAGSLCFSPIQCWNASWSVRDHYVSAPFSAEMPVDQCRITMFQPHSVLKCQLISAGSLCFSPIQCWNASWSVQDHYVSAPFSAEMPVDQCRITMFQPHSVLKCQLISAGSLCFSPFSAEMPVDQCRITMFQPHSVLKCQLISAGSLCFSPIQCWNASWSVQDHYVSLCSIMFDPPSTVGCLYI